MAGGQSIDELSDDERAWIDGMLSELEAKGLRGDLAGISALFDDHFAEWEKARPRKRIDPNDRVNTIGAGVGDILIQAIPTLRWALVSDEYGVEAAVVGEPGSIVVMPMNFAGKRWGERPGSIETDLSALIVQVRAVQAAAEPA